MSRVVEKDRLRALQFLGRRVEDMHSFFRQLIVLPKATSMFSAYDGASELDLEK